MIVTRYARLCPKMMQGIKFFSGTLCWFEILSSILSFSAAVWNEFHSAIKLNFTATVTGLHKSLSLIFDLKNLE